MTNMLKKTAGATAAAAAAGATALAMAPVASAAPDYTNVTDTFTAYEDPGAFNPGANGGDNVIVSPTYGTATDIFCVVDNGVYRSCYQEGWNHEPHQVHYVANINGHATWVTVDLPQGSSVPQLPTVELPAGSVAQSLTNITTGSEGSTGSGGGAGGGLNLNIGGSLGDIGLNLQGGTGSA